MPNADGRVQSIHLEGELTVDYSLAWSYGWDTPQVEQFQFKRLEAWAGTLALDGESAP